MTEYHIYSNAEAIPEQVFLDSVFDEKPYVKPHALKSLEKNNKDIYFNYLVFTDKGKNKTLGFFLVANLTVTLRPIASQSKCRIAKELISAMSNYAQGKNFNIMVCGHPFINGEHGFAYHKLPVEELKKIPGILENIAKSYHKTRRVKAILFKDFSSKEQELPQLLSHSRYLVIDTEPSMTLELKPEWQDMASYMEALKTKYRTKAKKALKESASLTIEEPSPEEIRNQLDELSQLYTQVVDKANFTLGRINLNNYAYYKQEIPEQFILKTYKLEGKLLGFMGAFVNGDTLDAHYVGLDYSKNKTYYVYQRMLYDYVEIAIQKRLKYINFGRSAGEIKSSIGAHPTPQYCYIRHRDPIHHTILSPILRLIRPNNFKLIKPFK